MRTIFAVTREWEQAVRRGSVEELRRLVRNGADLNARDSHGQTGLMLAAANGDLAVVEWFIESGAFLDQTAKYGLSALMLAVVRGHSGVVRKLAEAGADVSLRGTGAPGFSRKTALDLAVARGSREMVEILSAAEGRQPPNPHFETAESWRAARDMVRFTPLVPRQTLGLRLESIRIHVRDHRRRDLPIADRTLEAHYGRFVVSQARKGRDESRRLALEVSYGLTRREALIAGHMARVYELGPEPPPDDIDGRSPAVVTWHDGDMFYLVASGELSADELVRIAVSLYE